LQRYCHLLYPGGNGFAVIVVLVVVIDPAVVAPRRALRRGSLAAGLLQVQGHRRCLVGLSFVLSPARDTAGALGILRFRSEQSTRSRYASGADY